MIGIAAPILFNSTVQSSTSTTHNNTVTLWKKERYIGRYKYYYVTVNSFKELTIMRLLEISTSIHCKWNRNREANTL